MIISVLCQKLNLSITHPLEKLFTGNLCSTQKSFSLQEINMFVSLFIREEWKVWHILQVKYGWTFIFY